MREFGLLGKSLFHSFSKDYFNQKFQKEQLDARFSNFEINSIEAFQSLLATNNLSGLSVTIPYKETVIPFLDELTDEAKAIGAVNCIAFKNNSTIGHNTDVFGFQQLIKPFLTNQHERALILGTGGASKAVAYVLKQIGLDVLWISRTPTLPKQFHYSDLNEHMVNACKLIVNCTPIGTSPAIHETPFPVPQFVTEEHLCVDLIYNPAETRFLRETKAHGASTLNGLGMLKEQANKAWEIWNQ